MKNAAAPREKGIISVIRPTRNLAKGENYGFPACMAYLAECLGLDAAIYDFHYFAMATGDIFTQIHRDSLTDCTDCVTDWLFGRDSVDAAFGAIGFGCDYLDKAAIEADMPTALAKIRDSIDRSLPVISAGSENDWDFCIICGYTDEGGLRVMLKEAAEPAVEADLLSHTRGLVFAGEFQHEVNLCRQFSHITRSIYGCVTRKAERSCTFGAEAFAAWADSLVNGGIAATPSDDGWCGYGYNLCIAGTNGFAGTPMLKDILRKCPDFQGTRAYTVLKKVCACFDKQNEVFFELMNRGYGFDIPADKLRDVEFMRSAAEIIRKLCGVCGEIAELYPEKIRCDDDFWSIERHRIVKTFKEPIPPIRFVGMKYKNSDRVDGMFTAHWIKWHEEGRFAPLEALITEDFRAAYPESGDYIGLMKNKSGEGEDYFEYWIGMFLPAGCSVPDGCDYIDLDHDCMGICFIKGGEDDVYCHEGECYGALTAEGMEIPAEADGGCYMFERYSCPRFNAPDEYGEVILDLGFFVKKCRRYGYYPTESR